MAQPQTHTRTRRSRYGGREVVTRGLATGVFQDLFHYLMTVSWPRLFVAVAGFHVLFNILFGLLYWLLPGSIANLNPPGFAGAFFFSVETLATVGYGDMHPATAAGHTLATIEIFIGLMLLALITGLMFARFSRPRARFLFSNVGVVRPLDGQMTLIFRAANARQNVVQEASAQLRMLQDVITPEGFEIRRITDLPLVRTSHPSFSIGWTLMHVISPQSPLYGATTESLRQTNAAFVLSLSGIDETTGHLLMAREQYSPDALLWNAAFKDFLKVQDGRLHLDYAVFHETEPL